MFIITTLFISNQNLNHTIFQKREGIWFDVKQNGLTPQIRGQKGSKVFLINL